MKLKLLNVEHTEAQKENSIRTEDFSGGGDSPWGGNLRGRILWGESYGGDSPGGNLHQTGI